MAEKERKANQEIETLQADFAGWINKTHQLAAETFPGGDRTIAKARGYWNRESADALADEVFKFSSIYGAVPEGYHLRVGFTPMVFYALLKDAGDLSPLFKIFSGKAGNSYLAVTARRVEAEELNSGQSVLNMKPIGSGDHPESFGIDFERVSHQGGRQRIFAKIFPEDILSIEIVKNETPR